MKNRLIIIVLSLGALVAFQSLAFAGSAPPPNPGGQYQSATNAIFDLQAVSNNFIDDIIRNGQGVAKFADILFVFFVSLLIFRMVIAYMLYNLNYSLALRAVFLIAFVKFLMMTMPNGEYVYIYVTNGIYDAGGDIASEVQSKILGVNSTDPMAPINFIFQMIVGIMHTPIGSGCSGGISSFGCYMAHLGQLLFYAFFILPVMLFAALLAIISFYWSIWAVALLKFIGYVFIPFLLFDPLSKLFDGWFETFLSYVIYMVLVRINVCLMAFVMARMMFPGIPPATIIANPGVPVIPPSMSFLYWIGMLLWGGVAILSLFKTDDLAGSIVSGASGVSGSLAKFAT